MPGFLVAGERFQIAMNSFLGASEYFLWCQGAFTGFQVAFPSCKGLSPGCQREFFFAKMTNFRECFLGARRYFLGAVL